MRQTYTVSTLFPNQFTLVARVLAATPPDWSLVVCEQGEWRIQRYLTEREYVTDGNAILADETIQQKRFIRNSWYVN